MSAERVIAFVLYPELTVLDLIGPLEVLSSLGPPFRAVTVGLSMDPVQADSPIRLAPMVTFEELPHPDIIVVPGGITGTADAVDGNPTLDYVKSAGAGASIIASVCTGSIILGAAGFLHNRRATTHWSASGLMAQYGATYVRERWVRDGNVLTAAGVSAGIDMALALAAELAGEKIAKRIQGVLEYDPEPPLGPIDWSQLGKVQHELAEAPDLRALGRMLGDYFSS